VDDVLVQRHGDRRRPHLYFRATERRTGFDRRDASKGMLLRFLRDHPATLLTILVAVNAMNALDLLLTFGALRAGYASEGNLLMARLFSQGVAAATLFKLGLIGSVSVAIWVERRYRRTLGVAIVAAAAFAGVLLVHVWGLALYC
jgi:hypothetical protein